MTKEEILNLTHLTLQSASKISGLSRYKLDTLAKKYNLSFASKKPTKEDLSKLTHLTTNEVALHFNVSNFTVYKWCREYSIKLTRKEYDKSSSSKPNKEELTSLLHLTPKDVSDIYGVTKQCVSLWCKEYDIDFKSARGVSRRIKSPSKEALIDKTLKQICKEYSVSPSLASRWREENGIPVIFLKPTKEKLEELKHLSQVEIGEILGVSQTYVSTLYKKYNIERTNIKGGRKKDVI